MKVFCALFSAAVLFVAASPRAAVGSLTAIGSAPSFALPSLAVATPAWAAEDGEIEAAATDTAVERATERGPVRAVVRVEPASVLIGDTVALSLEVVAEDGVELFMPEFGQSLDRFAIIDFVPHEKVDDEGRTVATQHYTLQPPGSGKHTVPPILVEFVDRRPGKRQAPEGEDAYELITERLAFEVRSVLPADAEAGLEPPLGRLEPLATARAPLWPWLAAVFVLLAAAAPFAWQRWAAARTLARRRSAYEIAHSRLSVLMQRPRPGPDEMDQFFVELSGIVRRYLEDRFELRAPELTTEEFLDAASGTPDLTEENRGFLRGFLRSADMVKFARLIPEREDIDGALGAADRFLEQTKEGAKPIAEHPGAAAQAGTANA